MTGQAPRRPDSTTRPGRPHSAGPADPLYADALAVLAGWCPPDQPTAAARARTLELLQEGPAALTREHQRGHLTASTLVVSADGSRVLLCLHGKLGRWVQLGGHCEPADLTLAGAAQREATEESGIPDLMLHPTPIDVNIHPVSCGGGPSEHFDVRFAAVAPPGAVARVSPESRELGWFPPEALPTPLAHATSSLIAPALAVARSWATRLG